jgi:hypothetical protein
MGYEFEFLSVGEGEKCGDAILVHFGNLYGQRSERRVVVVDAGFSDTGDKVVDHVRTHYQTDYTAGPSWPASARRSKRALF